LKLANCKKCGKLYKKVLRDICDVCAAIERHELILIFRFIREHPDIEISLEQICRETNVPLDHLEDFYFTGQLANAGPRIVATCKLCSSKITSLTRKGYFCSKCSEKIQEEFGLSQHVSRKPIDISEIKLKTFHKNIFHSNLDKPKNIKYGFKKLRD
jgi:predicted amidophosphoribosyltransferase